MKIVGDMSFGDLSPKSTNIGNRIVKNMRICGSGIYTYRRQEAALLHLTPVPEKYSNLNYINVYRPPEVLEANKDMFARVPIITGHHIVVNTNNAKELAVGMVGDSVVAEADKDDGETYLYTTGTIIAGDGIDAYERYGQLSVGYDPIIEWESGTHKGVEYQAVLKGFNDINHLLICKVARGGPQCMVMDSLDELSPLERFINTHHIGGEDMGIFKKIFGSVKPQQVAGDSVVTTLLQSIAVGANPKVQVPKIRELVGDSDTTFNEYLGELEMAGDEEPDTVKRAVDIVLDHYNKMVGDSKEEDKPKEKEEKPAAGDEEKPKKEEPKEDEKPKEEPKTAGDSIDYEKIASMVADKIIASNKEESKTAGDEKPVEDTMIISGDSTDKNTVTSDSILADLFGGM